jgi:DNA repair exonuclease SbcCD nuclease subunit
LKSKSNINYWALGHIHKCSIINNFNPAIIYPGIPQGRDFGEEGPGGVILVEVEDKKINTIKYAVTSEVIWRRITINLDRELGIETKNISDLENLIADKCEEMLKSYNSFPEGLESLGSGLEELIKGYVVKWTINGRSDIYNMLTGREEEVQDYLVERLNSRFSYSDTFLFTSSIVFNIGRPIKDLEQLMENNNTIREISELSNKSLMDETLKQELIKSMGSLWSAADSEEDLDVRKLLLDDAALMEIIKQAEQLAIDAVLQRGDEV